MGLGAKNIDRVDFYPSQRQGIVMFSDESALLRHPTAFIVVVSLLLTDLSQTLNKSVI